LAQSSETRSSNLPEVPTLQEAGFKELVLETWYAAFVPLGTPAAAIARLNAEMDKTLADPATGKSLLQTATEPVGGSAEQLARVARAVSEKYARLARQPIRSAGVRKGRTSRSSTARPPDEATPLLQFFDPTGSGHFIQRLAICKCTPILVPSLSVN
jgi:Tripartite tricarboxylate transporter family receptor